MAKKVEEEKPVLEREYIIPLRKQWLKVPKYKRSKKAIKAVKEFIAKHMKVPDRDVRKVKLDKWLNQEIWFKGIRKPPAKIKVKAIKYSEKVIVQLSEIPEKIKYLVEREKLKEKVEKEKKVEEKKLEEEEKEKLEEKVEKPEEEKEETEEKKKEAVEKAEAVKETAVKQAGKAARIKRHEAAGKKVQIHRMALKK